MSWKVSLNILSEGRGWYRGKDRERGAVRGPIHILRLSLSCVMKYSKRSRETLLLRFLSQKVIYLFPKKLIPYRHVVTPKISFKLSSLFSDAPFILATPLDSRYTTSAKGLSRELYIVFPLIVSVVVVAFVLAIFPGEREPRRPGLLWNMAVGWDRNTR